VTPEIVDRILNDFWNEALKLGPEQIAVLDGIEFVSLLKGSKEWPIVLEGIRRDIAVSSQPLDEILGAIHMTLRMGILIGLETAARSDPS
jgi:hypothetical protein